MTTSTKPFRQWVPMDETPEEKAKRLGVPCVPVMRDTSRSDDENPIVAVCGACGLECRQRMQYACLKAECPMVGR